MIDFIKIFSLILVLLIFQSYSKPDNMQSTHIDIQGHRGARGLMPENTIPAFLKAVALGTTTLELDLAVTKDGQLLVSHEPFMNSLTCLDPDGNEIAKEEELNHNIYQMSLEQIKSYDCGSKFYKRFPNQQKMKINKPLLSEVIAAVDQFVAKQNLRPVRYNIEIKSNPVGDSIFHPKPAEFSKLVYNFIVKNMDKQMVNVQSFDFRILKYYKENYPDIRLAVLIEDPNEIDANLENLGFVPDIYSCYHHLLDSQKIAYLHSLKMKVIPWTVNEKESIDQLITWGVDGIISDYPDRVIDAVSK